MCDVRAGWRVHCGRALVLAALALAVGCEPRALVPDPARAAARHGCRFPNRSEGNVSKLGQAVVRGAVYVIAATAK